MDPRVLWLDKPAERWLDAFPIGNGKIGAMVFGGVARERLALNHENLWRGVTRDRTTKPVHQHLPAIREALLDGRFMEGQELAVKYISGHDRRVQPYQPVGDLWIELMAVGSTSKYRSSLDLATAVAEVSYESGGVAYKRESFASADRKVVVTRLSADKPGTITATINLARIEDPDCEIKSWSDGTRFGFEGKFVEGIEFAAQAAIATRGGRVTSGSGASVSVDGADEVLILVAMATDYKQPDPKGQCGAILDAAPADFAKLHTQHVAEYGSYFNRVALDVPTDPEAEKLPVDQRLERMKAGKKDPGLIARYFDLGRYLLISSSRKCDQPANLQGIWNEQLQPPWDSDIHLDVNIEMNYWPAETCGLADCVEPMLGFMERLVPHAQKVSRDLYDCRGISFCIQTDIWDRPTPEAPQHDLWTGGAAWVAEHFWWRWQYSRDRQFLEKRAYPFLKLCAEFYEDFLVKNDKGRLVTAPSLSPENRYISGSEKPYICVGATMDLLLIREVMERCIEASKLLGADLELRPKWEAVLNDLPPYQIGKHGQLQEWLEDFDEAEPGHRHISHLLGVHPGDSMTPDRLPEFYKAARVSLERRLASGGGHTGWSRSWVACQWARHHEGDLAYEHLEHLVTDFGTASLLDLHPPQIFQIDGNFGGTAGIAELLMQSHEGFIRLLPALPGAWPCGSVKGLKAQAGFGVDIDWRDGVLYEARITSELGGPCEILLPKGEFKLVGKPVSGRVSVETKPGQMVVIQA